MGIIDKFVNKLLLGAKNKPIEESHFEAEMIHTSLRVINESIDIARKSKKIETQISRLKVAEDTLNKARIEATKYSVNVDGFNQAENEINRIRKAIQEGTPIEIDGMTKIDIIDPFANESRTLLKQATALKKEKKYIEACNKLQEAYEADGADNLMIEERLRLPMYLQLAGKNDEGWDELNRLAKKYTDKFSQPIISNQMSIFLRKENNENRQNPVRIISDKNMEIVEFKSNHIVSEQLNDIYIGIEFVATLQIRTPLIILTRDGEIYSGNDDKQPDIAIEGWEGIWIPKLKPQYKLDLNETSKMMCSSDIGYVYKKEYLEFLIDLRKIIELNDTIDNRIAALHEHYLSEKWKNYIDKHNGADKLIQYFFPKFVNTIPSLNDETVDELIKNNLVTPNAIATTNDSVLLDIKGIGKSKLKIIRNYCVKLTKNRDHIRIDSVNR